MNKAVVQFLAAGVLSGVVAASGGADAAGWHRTIHGSACVPNLTDSPFQYPNSYQCPFTSDAIAGATSIGGNGGVTSIYADYVVGEVGAKNVTITACGISYGLTGGSCGTAATFASQANGIYDIALPIWTGTASPWDYFYVDFHIQTGGYIRPIGIGVAGAN